MIQVGDFYEAFFNDAVVLAKELNLTLTSRDKNSDNPTPMAGMPQSVIDSYVNRLLSRGHSVAIISQDGSGKSVTRFLDRLVTPGVNLASTYEEVDENNLLCVFVEQNEVGEISSVSISYSNLISGIIYQEDFNDWNSALKKIILIDPKEIVVPRMINDRTLDLKKTWVRELFKQFKFVKFRTLRNSRNCSEINGFIAASNTAQKAVQLLICYVDEITIEKNINFQSVQTKEDDNTLQIDSRTRNNLELVKNQKDGSEQGTLFQWLNSTKTAGGKRLLKNWILNPLFEKDKIVGRYENFNKLIEICGEVQKKLSVICDLEKISTRIDLEYVNPLELVALRDSLKIIPELNTLINNPSLYLEDCTEVLELLDNYLLDSPANSIKYGGVVSSKLDPELERLRNLKTSGAEWIINFENQEKISTGILNLKAKYTEIHGYFIEVTKTHLEKVPAHYIKKQSTLNSEKFTTIELRAFETDILSSESKAIEIEKKYFLKLVKLLQGYTSRLKAVALVFSTIDALNCFALKTVKYGLRRPEIADFGLNIKEGKHPILLEKLGMDFMPNGLDLDREMVVVLVGPNMGGKSTFLRQTALLVILAQIGCYVPAESMKFSLVDRLFARIGATDDIHEGDSTFMVEMREASFILKNATEHSLVLIDELGRGTATKDGMSIAQAVLEDLISKNIRTVFATHYHELTELKSEVVQSLSVGCYEQDGDIVFTHQIVSGSTNRSYGYEVARLAGVSDEIVNRAREIANRFSTQVGEQLKLNFNSPAKEYRFIEELKKTNLDRTAPIEALNLLVKIKNEINS